MTDARETPAPRPLEGREVAITGRMIALDREQAIRLVGELGGSYAETPGPETSLLVLGDAGWPLRRDGRLTHHVDKARELQAEGHAIEIVSEAEFLSGVGRGELGGGTQRLYTTQQLARILKVEVSEITSWVRQGLIRPVQELYRVLYFDFPQVASAKALQGLLAAGVRTAEIRKSLHQVQSWWPNAARSIAQLGTLAEGSTLLVRLESGALAEADGQLHLDFGDDEAAASSGSIVPLADHTAPQTAEEWFRHAVELEEGEHLEEAADAYHACLLSGGPEAAACFNLGNVLYRMGRPEEAAQRYMQTVEIDGDYVEAWNNLGNALGDAGRLQRAVKAYRRALEIMPRYPDAHYNLAETLFALGEIEDAREHWRAYLDLDPSSSWAATVRTRLETTEEAVDEGREPS
jgi:tetratricopeptide (TPR) repeat protein